MSSPILLTERLILWSSGPQDVAPWTDGRTNRENSPSIRPAERLGLADGESVRLLDPLAALLVDTWGQSAAAWRARRVA